MSPLPTRFFAVAAFFALCGMAWGIQMAASGDHLLSPAHGHLNLIGFVAMSVFGTYYALTPVAAGTILAKIHFWLVTTTVVIFTPGIALAITGRGEILAQVGAFLAFASMALFAYVVVRYGAGGAVPKSGPGVQPTAQPAE